MQTANYWQRVLFGIQLMATPTFFRLGFLFAPFVLITVLFGAFAPPEHPRQAFILVIVSTIATAAVGSMVYACLLMWIFS